jgi:hypothetical protein
MLLLNESLKEVLLSVNTSLSVFLKIAVSVVVIAALLFSVAYGMIENESNHYKSKIEENMNSSLTR